MTKIFFSPSLLPVITKKYTQRNVNYVIKFTVHKLKTNFQLNGLIIIRFDCKKTSKERVAKARNKAYEELYEKLETREEKNELFKIAKQRNRQSKDVQQVRVIKSKTGE